MKGDATFRHASKAYQQFHNEDFIYTDVLPRFQQLLDDHGQPIRLDATVAPHLHYGFFGVCPELASAGAQLDESILAVRDLRPEHFRTGPPLLLDEPHMRLALALCGRYHALSYALRLTAPEDYRRLVAGLRPMPFRPDAAAGEQRNLYTVLYDVAMQRFMRAVRRRPDTGAGTAAMRGAAERMAQRWGARPVELLERFQRDDAQWTCILHGDFNRNNVLFRYTSGGGGGEPLEARMIDFQEVRVASPALDLSFIMYMNTDLGAWSADVWEDLLRHYHEAMMGTLCAVLGWRADDERLRPFA